MTASVRYGARIALALALVIPLLAASVARGLAQDEELVVTVVTDTAGLGDGNFNDLANEGLIRAETELGIRGEVLQSLDATQYQPNLLAGAENSDLTVGVGFLLQQDLDAVAAGLPDEKFLLIDAVAEAENVSSVLFREQEGAFLAGIVAARTTKTNKIGIVGGIRVPPVERYEVGFVAGVRTVNPGIEVVIAYAEDFEDPALGKELALAQFNQGADIVFPIAGRTGSGCYEAVVEKGEGFLVIGADRNQEDQAPGQQMAVVKKGVDAAVFTAAEQLVNDEFAGGVQDIGLKEGGVDLTNLGAMVTDEVAAEAALYKQAIIDGKFQVPATDADLATFTAPDVSSFATPVATPSS